MVFLFSEGGPDEIWGQFLVPEDSLTVENKYTVPGNAGHLVTLDLWKNSFYSPYTLYSSYTP